MKYLSHLILFSILFILSGHLKAQDFVPVNHPLLREFRPTYEAVNPSDFGLLPDWFEDEIVQLGYIPVGLLGAFPDDGIDDTQAIQRTIQLARDYGYVTYIPKGEYLIGNTLEGALLSHDNTGNSEENSFWNDRFRPVQIVGDCSGTGRTVLKINPDSIDVFTHPDPNETTMKPLLQIYAQVVSSAITTCMRSDSTLTTDDCWNPDEDLRETINAESSASNFNAWLRNIDFDVSGANNAVAVRMAGAQGCTMENCNIDATGAYAGLTGGLGSAGGYFNIGVTGGQYGYIGLDPSITQELLFVGMKFIDQENAVFRAASQKGHVIVGLEIEKDGPRIFDRFVDRDESIFSAARGGGGGFSGSFADSEGVSIIDAKITIENDDPNDALFWLRNGNNFYLQNVFVSSNVTHITRLTSRSGTRDADILRGDDSRFNGSTDYFKIKTFAHQRVQNNAPNRNILWDFGKAAPRTTDSLSLNTNSIIPTGQELIDTHVGHIKESPCVFSGDPNNPLASDVRIIPAIRGIDTIQDRGLINSIINLNTRTKIFIPRGVFLVDHPIELRNNFVVFGASKTNSVLRATADMHTRDVGRAIIQTDASPNGAARLQDLFLQDYLPNLDQTDSEQFNNRLSFIHWRQGANSVVQNVSFGDYNTWTSAIENSSEFRFHEDAFFIKVSENGGGFWYGVHGTHTSLRQLTRIDSHRGFIADGAQNLSMYSFNHERYGTGNEASAQIEFRNSRNIKTYLFKTETGGGTGGGDANTTPLRINQCSEIEIHGASGRIESLEWNDVQGTEGIGGLIEVNNSCGITISSAKAFFSRGMSFTIIPDSIRRDEMFTYIFTNANDDQVVEADSGYVAALWISEGSVNCDAQCLDVVYMTDELIDENQTIEAAERIELLNVNVVDDFDLKLNAPTVLFRPESESLLNATLETIHTGCTEN